MYVSIPSLFINVTPGKLAILGAGALAVGVGMHVLGEHVDNDLLTHAGDALAIGGGATLIASAGWAARNFIHDSSYRTAADIPVGKSTLGQVYERDVARFAVARSREAVGGWTIDPVSPRAVELGRESVFMDRLRGLLSVADQPGANPARISTVTVSLSDAGDAVASLGMIKPGELAAPITRVDSRTGVRELRSLLGSEGSGDKVVLGWFDWRDTELTITSDAGKILADFTPAGKHSSIQALELLNAAATGAHELAHARASRSAPAAFTAVMEGAAEVSGEAHAIDTAAAMKLPINPNDLPDVIAGNGYQVWTTRLRSIASLGGIDVGTTAGRETFDTLQSTLGPQQLLRELLGRVADTNGLDRARVVALARDSRVLEDAGWSSFIDSFRLDRALERIHQMTH